MFGWFGLVWLEDEGGWKMGGMEDGWDAGWVGWKMRGDGRWNGDSGW